MGRTDVNQALVDEILGGDPLLTPAEAAAELGITTDVLRHRHDIPAIRLPLGHNRYRTSAIAAAKARQDGQ